MFIFWRRMSSLVSLVKQIVGVWNFSHVGFPHLRCGVLMVLLPTLSVAVIQSLGEQIKVRQQVIATATIYFKRFYARLVSTNSLLSWNYIPGFFCGCEFQYTLLVDLLLPLPSGWVAWALPSAEAKLLVDRIVAWMKVNHRKTFWSFADMI